MASFDEVIPPGQAGEVRAKLKTKNLRGTLARGITLTTNDPARPTVYLKMRAQIVGSVLLLPRSSFSVNLTQAARPVDRILLRKDPTEEGELNITEVSASQGWLRADARRVEEPEPPQRGFPAAQPGDWVVEVGAGEGAPSGVRRESVKFKTGLPREPIVTVPVLVRVTPPITVRPRRLVLADPGDEEATHGTIMAVIKPSLEGKEFSIEAAPAPFEVAWEQTGTRHFRAKVSWKSAGPESPRSGVVVLKVGTESVSIPVSVRYPSPKPSPAPSSRPASGS